MLCFLSCFHLRDTYRCGMDNGTPMHNTRTPMHSLHDSYGDARGWLLGQAKRGMRILIVKLNTVCRFSYPLTNVSEVWIA